MAACDDGSGSSGMKPATPDLKFTPTNNNTAYSVSKGTAIDAEVVIPLTYNGLPVIEIAANGFRNYTIMKSIAIPNSVTIIGTGAFSGCSSLTSVTIPNSVKSIISYEMFQDCSSLTSIAIPNSMTIIYERTFSDCSSLTSITIPNSVTKIDSRAFEGCSSLTNVTIGNGVMEIGASAFEGCSSLICITVDATNQYFSSQDDILYDKAKTQIVVVPVGIKNITIPNSMTSIGYRAFAGCSNLTSVTIPNNVTKIDSLAFEGCSSLTNITIGNGVTEFGYSVFEGCSSLTSVTMIGETPPELYSDIFGDINSDLKIYVPAAKVNVYKAIWEMYGDRIFGIVPLNAVKG